MVAERTGYRDLTYSHWHRGCETGRPGPLSVYADIDGLEYCHRCYAPLLLVETAKTNGRGERHKHYPQLVGLARAASVPAVLVFYTPGPAVFCVACERQYPSMTEVFVRWVWPERTTERRMTALHWALEIDDLHEAHVCA